MRAETLSEGRRRGEEEEGGGGGDTLQLPLDTFTTHYFLNSTNLNSRKLYWE